MDVWIERSRRPGKVQQREQPCFAVLTSANFPYTFINELRIFFLVPTTQKFYYDEYTVGEGPQWTE